MAACQRQLRDGVQLQHRAVDHNSWAYHTGRMLLRAATTLTLVSCVAFALGLYFPARALMDAKPSVMIYGIVLVSYPAWVTGTVAATVAAYLFLRADETSPRLEQLSWLMGVLNLAAAALTVIWNPPGVS
jgi:hypothetical protein